ncbi:hypothetical protein [Nocardia transvalensis]|uniref:hypothetical protein n=1 Tax=Nocardia transvalensis TaxID=37333 RepID=UPI001895F7E7|nr:hypothetical protein [Nocardia transvalensis]MBF6332134.1 hypothetical protein [Nocardia transvalensis]
MVTFQTRGRSAIALAAAGALLAFPTVLIPAADAAPVSAWVHTQSQRQGESPLGGIGMTLDLDSAIDLAAHGIKVDRDIRLTVGKGSKITYGKKVTGGTVRLHGRIQLSKDNKKTTISNMVYDLETGVLAGKFGSKSNVHIATVRHPGSVQVVTHEGQATATLKLVDQGTIELSPDFFAALDEALGTTLSTDMDVSTGIDVDATLDVDVNLANGQELNTDLITALGLDDDIDTSLGLEALLETDLDVDTELF